MAFRVLIDKKDLQIGETMVFDYTEVGIPRQGFLARLEDGWVAYENRCRHLRSVSTWMTTSSSRGTRPIFFARAMALFTNHKRANACRALAPEQH